MKIAIVNKFYPPVIGGIEYHVRLLAENLVEFPVVEKVEVIVANDISEWKSEKVNEKLVITRVPNWRTVASTPIAPAFIKYFRTLDADIVHFHFPYPFGDFAWLLSCMNKPVAITYHSDILRQKVLNYFYAPIRNMFFSRADRIIATSPRLIQCSSVLQKFRDKTVVVPLGINPDKFLSIDGLERGQKLKNKYHWQKPVVLFVGRLVYYKGVEYLVEAFKDIDAQLVMVGKGVLKEKLQDMVKSYCIEDKVSFYESVSDDELVAFYHGCDVFVLPSVASTEAYGLVQLEAMACGKPVISTNLPTGVPYVNQHGVTGLVVEPCNVKELAEAIDMLVNNKELRERFGRQAKERMLREFTDRSMVAKIVDIYQDILTC